MQSKCQVMPSNLPVRSHKLTLGSVVAGEKRGNDVTGPVERHCEVNEICEKRRRRRENLPEGMATAASLAWHHVPWTKGTRRWIRRMLQGPVFEPVLKH